MRIPYFLGAIILFTARCTNPSNKKITPNQSIVNESKKDSFFPVTSFLKGQMIVLDSLSITPLHTITINNKTDSIWLKKGKLNFLLVDFLSPEIMQNNLTDYFKETSFNDLTLNTITYTYDPIKILPDSISLRHWDIYIDPETGKILKVYIVKQLKEAHITQQLTWKTNNWASITTLINTSNGNAQLQKEEKFIWNFN